MWFRSRFASPGSLVAAQRPRPLRQEARRRQTRRQFLEGLEYRRLMAFNVLAEYVTGVNPSDVTLAQIDAGSQFDLVVANNSASQG